MMHEQYEVIRALIFMMRIYREENGGEKEGEEVMRVTE